MTTLHIACILTISYTLYKAYMSYRKHKKDVEEYEFRQNLEFAIAKYSAVNIGYFSIFSGYTNKDSWNYRQEFVKLSIL